LRQLDLEADVDRLQLGQYRIRRKPGIEGLLWGTFYRDAIGDDVDGAEPRES